MILPSEYTLLIPQKSDEERMAVAYTWQSGGGFVLPLDRFWEKPAHLQTNKIAIYGNDTFALVVAQIMSVHLISPDDFLLVHLSNQWTKRKIYTSPLSSIANIPFPVFCKPGIPKQFKAAIYDNQQDLLTETMGLPADTQLIISEIISIEAEARCFVLHQDVKDIAIYEGIANLEEGKNFIKTFLKNHTDLPKTFVADLGYNRIVGWFILEFNASWGAGLNHCDPNKVIECIISATVNL